MIHLVTDTTAYLPASLMEAWNVHVVPLKITVGNETVDEDKITLKEFYKYLDSVESAPSTSQPAPGEFMNLYQSLLNNGDEIISLHISSGLSGTPLVAEMAAHEIAPDRITVFDTQTTSCGLAMLVLKAAQAIAEGQSREEVLATLQEMSESQEALFVVRDLNYLAKGGRINGAAKFLGSMLNLRPILHLNEGKIDGLKVARTYKRGMAELLNEMEKRLGQGPLYASVTHILCEDEAHAFADQVRERFDCREFFVNETGPVIGSHVGPGFIGFAGCPLSRN